MTSLGALGLVHMPITLAYIVINIDPILLRIGSLAIHWYGLMYVVAITVGLWATLRYTARLGIHEDQAWGLFVWTAIAGLIGGRLYFVIQQRDLVSNYLLKPWNIIAVWNGGMAFFGAIFLGSATLFVLAPRYGLSRFIAIDGGAFFAAIGQIFGRFGNIINGDILGQAVSQQLVNIPQNTCAQAPCIAFVSDPTISPWWSVVYLNPAVILARTGIAYHPAPVYEILFNLIMLALLWPVRFRLPRIRAGLFFLMYLALYAVSQFIVFFARGSEEIVDFLGTHILKQAQWTAVVVLLLCIPLYFVIMRVSRPWPYSQENPVPWDAAPGKSSLDPLDADAQGDNADDAEPVELPPWQPVRAVGGALRNVFVPSRASGEH